MIQQLKKAVETVMNQDRPRQHRLLAGMLAGGAVGYGGATALRAALYRRGWLSSRRLSCPVIAVGNITVGGTGKTPLVMALARRLGAWGYRVVVVSRGYKGAAEASGGVVSDGTTLFMGPDSAGDEPFMMAAGLPGVPVVVGKDRFRAGLLAQARFDPQILVLDDAFQHLRLHRDLNLLVMDARRPLGNGRLLPRGPLREPHRALARADAFVLTRAGGPDFCEPEKAGPLAGFLDRKPVFHAHSRICLHRAEPGARPPAGFAPPALEELSPASVAGLQVVALAGIARPERFFRSLEALGARIAESMVYPDHHWYREADLAGIAGAAERCSAAMVMTTAKDWARLFSRWDRSVAVGVVDVETRFGADQDAFDHFLKNRLAAMDRQGGRP